MTSKVEKKPTTSRAAKKPATARVFKAKTTANSGGTKKGDGTGTGDTAGSYSGNGEQNSVRQSTPESNYFCGCRSCYCGSAVHAPGDLCSICMSHSY
jgi:hypothetical protein